MQSLPGYETGQHSIIWDGLNSAGVPVSSGVYLVRMETGVFNEVRKLTLMR